MHSAIAFVERSVVGCVTFGRLQRAIEEAGRQRNLSGDCLAETRFRSGTPDDELQALDIYLALPIDVRRAAPELTHRMARSLVLSHHDDHDEDVIEMSCGSRVERPNRSWSAIVRATRQPIVQGNPKRSYK